MRPTSRTDTENLNFFGNVQIIPGVLKALKILDEQCKDKNLFKTNEDLKKYLSELPDDHKYKHEALRAYRDIHKCTLPVLVYSKKEVSYGLTLSELMIALWQFLYNITDSFNPKDNTVETRKLIIVKGLANLEAITAKNIFFVYNQLAHIFSYIHPEFNYERDASSNYLEIARFVINHNADVLSKMNLDEQHQILASWFDAGESSASIFRAKVLKTLVEDITRKIQPHKSNVDILDIKNISLVYLYVPKPVFKQQFDSFSLYYDQILDTENSKSNIYQYTLALKAKLVKYRSDPTTCPSFYANLANLQAALHCIEFSRELPNEYLIYARRTMLRAIKLLGNMKIKDEKDLATVIKSIHAVANLFLPIDGKDDGICIRSTYVGLAPWYRFKSELNVFSQAYEGFHNIIFDLAMPLLGVLNILHGILNMLASPVCYINNHDVNAAITMINSTVPKANLDKPITDLLVNFEGFKDRFKYGFMSIIHGIGQIITTPYHWFKIPFRLAKTLYVNCKVSRKQHSIFGFPFHFGSRSSPASKKVEPESTYIYPEDKNGQFAVTGQNFFPSLSDSDSTDRIYNKNKIDKGKAIIYEKPGTASEFVSDNTSDSSRTSPSLTV